MSGRVEVVHVLLDGIQPALMKAVLDRDEGNLVRKSGVMGIVLAGDAVRAELPAEPQQPLEPV